MNFTTIARERAKEYWDGSFEHPFIKELHEGTLKDEVFRYYLLQDRYYLEHFSQLYARIADWSEDLEVKELMVQNAKHLAEGELMIREEFFQQLGITEEEIQKTPIAPTAYHYVSHMYRQLVTSTPSIACASLLPCSWLYHTIGVLLVNQQSPNSLYQKWIDTYSGEESYVAVERECQVLNRLYEEASESEKEKMIEAFYISSQMEYLFWEMAYQLEKWPSGKDYIIHEKKSN